MKKEKRTKSGGLLMTAKSIIPVFALLIAISPVFCFANSAPVVSNVSVSQRKDGSGMVDISYTLSDADNNRCTIAVLVSNNGGSTWTITPSAPALSGDLTNVSPGSRHITWNSKLDLPGVFGSNYRIKVTADDGVTGDPTGMVGVSINDPGSGDGHEGFNGQMSKYETTNAQYCQYLNAAKASGAITVSGSYVVGTSGPYSGQNYYNLDGAGYTFDGVTNGGAARINYSGGSFTVDSGFENHPVTYVSWYGATAFCNYYGYRLPTEWEWQAVADYDGSYLYGCGTTINNSIANYLDSIHPDGTTAVGAFGTYGYGMCDMTGNALEWTTSIYPGYRIMRGGYWNSGNDWTVGARGISYPYSMYPYSGFRVCRLTSGYGGLSNIFTIDNRNTGNTPVIVDLSSPYCSQTKKAYFLSGVLLDQTFTATIDWNGSTASQVKWYRNTTLIATDTVSGNSVSRTFNVGTAFNVSERLYVQAIDSNGIESAQFVANFEIVSPPPGLPAAILFFQNGKYKSFPFNIGFPELKKDPPVLTGNNTIPEIAQVSWKSIIEVTAEIDLIGHAEIKAGSDYMKLAKDDFKLSGLEVGGRLKVVLTFDYASGQWKSGGGFDLSVFGEYKAPPKYVVFMVGLIPVPTYYRFTIDASVEADCRFTDGSADDPVFSGDIPVGGGVEGMAGAGFADHLSGEGYLKGGLNFDFQVPQKPYLKDWYLTLDGGIRLYIIHYKYENNFLSYRWPQEQGDKAFGVKALTVENLEPMSRDYLAGNYAQWYGSGSKLKTMNMQLLGAGGTETTLQTNIFGQSNAVLAVSGSTKCLIWLYDEPSRNSLDRTMLVYSINNGSDWSAPTAVNDDGTADAMPALAVDANGNFVCVWANASQLIPDGTNLSGFADKLDIKMATYNSVLNTWTSETVTNAAALDYNPKVACDGSGNITVVWTHDNNNDMLTENPPVSNTLLARTKTGTGWQTPQTLATVSGLVKYTNIQTYLAGTHIVYCLDSDSDLQTDTDNELYYIANTGGGWSASTRLTNDPNADVNPQLVRTSSDLMLIWARDGNIVSTTDISGMTGIKEVVAQQGSSGQRSFKAVVSPTDNISVIWNDPSAAGSDIYTATYDPTMLAWSNVVQITDNRDMERSICAVYSAANTLELAYNKVYVVDGNGLGVFGQVDLCTYEYLIGADLDVNSDNIIITDSNAVSGNTVTLQATIANVGDIAVSNIPVAFYCGQTAIPANQIGQTQTITGALAAGGHTTVSVSWTIPDSNDPLNVIVVIDPNLQIEDKNRQNNSASIKMFGADLAVENVVINRDVNNTFYITADVVNIGFIPVTAGVEFIVTGPNDSNALDNQLVAALEPNQSHTITLTVSTGQLNYGFNELKLIVDPNNTIVEISKGNNIRTIIVTNAHPCDLVVDGIIDLLDLGVLASQWLNTTGDLSADIAPDSGDGIVDFLDFAKLAEFWLQDVTGFEEGFESGDFSKYPWLCSSDANWTVVSDTAYEGSYAAKSGTITDNQQSTLEITLNKPFENISFYRKVSSESDYDYLRFYIDGVEQSNWSGSQDWEQQTYTITPGQHTFNWSYTKNGSVNSGSDCAWIDNILLY